MALSLQGVRVLEAGSSHDGRPHSGGGLLPLIAALVLEDAVGTHSGDGKRHRPVQFRSAHPHGLEGTCHPGKLARISTKPPKRRGGGAFRARPLVLPYAEGAWPSLSAILAAAPTDHVARLELPTANRVRERPAGRA